MDELLDEGIGLSHDLRDYEYASFLMRVFATIIDAVVYAPLVVLTYYNSTHWNIQELSIFISIATLIYKPVMEANFGATVGKMVLGIKVVKLDYEKISINEAIIRNFPWLFNSTLSIISSIAILISGSQSFVFSEGAVVINTISGIVSLFGLAAVIAVIFNRKKQGLHDMIAKTYVVMK